MDLRERIGSIESKEDLVKFISLLRVDFQNNKAEWENITLEDYLEAMEAWITDMDGYYETTDQPIPKHTSWKVIADILYASSMYE